MRLNYLILPLIGAAIIHSSSPAGDIIGHVNRPPLRASVDEKPIDRYRGRTSGDISGTDTTGICDPSHCAVVYLTGDSLPPFRPLDYHPSITQKDMTFQPSVLAVTVGSTVDFPNLDPYFHNVFSYSKAKKFDLGRYEKGKSKSVTFDTPGLIKIFCEIHYSMRAYLHVLATPYFAVTDDKESFLIKDVKPGKYTLHLWQENQDDKTMPITVTEKNLELVIE